jgi:hypothetical protein
VHIYRGCSEQAESSRSHFFSIDAECWPDLLISRMSYFERAANCCEKRAQRALGLTLYATQLV